MAKYRCAILDDFQNVALKVADWSKVSGDLEVKVFNEHLGGPDNVVKALQGFQIVCAMRERTGFPRAVIEKLPDLKLLITTGMRNASIDMAAAADKGVTVCGTGSFGSPTSGIAIGLMLELTRHIGYENARLKAGETWQVTIGPELEGMTLGILGLGKLGTRTAPIGKAFGMRVIAWSTEPHAREVQGGGGRIRDQGRAVQAVGLHFDPRRAVAALARAGRRGGIRADEADGLSHQHLARADRGRGGHAGRTAGQEDRRRRPRRVRRRAAAEGSSAAQDGQRRASRRISATWR